MNVKLTRWGNSMGIRLPKEIINVAHLHEGSSLVIKFSEKKGTITLVPEVEPHAGWKEAFNMVADQGQDGLLIDDSLENDFDEDEWRW
ncbi:MAG: AbrB/MazE/SpoVT family DNA-binding domain-containing protein [Gammaproteobacteria bacterium]